MTALSLFNGLSYGCGSSLIVAVVVASSALLRLLSECLVPRLPVSVCLSILDSVGSECMALASLADLLLGVVVMREKIE